MDRRFRDKQRLAYTNPADNNSLWAYIACLERMAGVDYRHGPDKRLNERFKIRDWVELIGQKVERTYDRARKKGRNGRYILTISESRENRKDIPFSLSLEQLPDCGKPCPKIIYPPDQTNRPLKSSVRVEVPRVSRLLLESNLKIPDSPASWFGLNKVLNERRF